MSFLDRFKRKASEEKTQENAPEAKPVPAPESKAEPAPPRKPDPAVQIAAATVAAGYNPDFKLPSKKEASSSIPAPSLAGFAGPQHEITLELGDFLQRIPAHLLGDQKPDPATPLAFEVGELADRIARGQTTVPVSEIYRRVPGIFRGQILPADNAEVRFPWQKVMKMLVAHRNQQGGAGPVGLTAAAADSLAEKLRSRRAVRNIIPGSPADTQAQSPAGSPLPPPAAAPLPKPPEIPIPPTNAEEDEKMTKEDAIKARDVMRSLVARMKGEYERQLAAADQQRKSLLDEREKVIVELVRAKKDSDDKNEQVEFEKSVAAKSADNLAKVQQERDGFKIELSNLKVELGRASTQNDQRIKDLVAERDALAQQQANLSKQITEFQKRGKIGAALTEAAAAAAPSGAAAAAAQKQVEELQRRIGVLETAQRDNAQELAREREAKIKAERQLAAADRTQQESATKLQELQNSLQREHDSTLRKRDAESGRGLKEVQDQSSALQAANLKLTADLEETRKKLAAAQEAIAAAPQPEQWEARIAAQFESDIDTYRTRIKGLLQEKEAINSEKQKLAAQVAEHEKSLAQHGEQKQVFAKVEAEHKQTQGDAAQLRTENEKLQEQLKSLQAEFTTVTATLAALQGVEAEHNKAKGDIGQARTENENLQAQLKSLQTERESLSAKVQALQTVEAEHNKAKGDIGQARTENENLQAQLKSLQTERESLSAKVQALQ
ncbi:MAG TPA: hypothetical protein VK961_05725, partial [Chthoniobacter sp.]|nr:hypothetical protein [Chthoniobacter sp.]